eukprot:GHVT01026290.1.p1 GENE.GHVT01026290.1~~GHVT01026290.1.p1  ORF type:complete len:126 (+),score=33.85 GHVT01026290.1:312-689(+)
MAHHCLHIFETPAAAAVLKEGYAPAVHRLARIVHAHLKPTPDTPNHPSHLATQEATRRRTAAGDAAKAEAKTNLEHEHLRLVLQAVEARLSVGGDGPRPAAAKSLTPANARRVTPPAQLDGPPRL